MMRSLSSAVAGLRTHQTKMDVIGNNIANVNTFGFKSSRATFSDVYYQNLSGSKAGQAQTTGGKNPTQIGYGASVATIDMMMNVSGNTTTDRALDVYISGEGFLVTKDVSGRTFYSRLGNLGFDAAGNLVDGNGYLVQGFPMKADPDNPGFMIPDVPATGVADAATVRGIFCDPAIMERMTGIEISPTGKIIGLLSGDQTIVYQGSEDWINDLNIPSTSSYNGTVSWSVSALYSRQQMADALSISIDNVREVMMGTVALPTRYDSNDDGIVDSDIQYLMRKNGSNLEIELKGANPPMTLVGTLNNNQIVFKSGNDVAMTVKLDPLAELKISDLVPATEPSTLNQLWAIEDILNTIEPDWKDPAEASVASYYKTISQREALAMVDPTWNILALHWDSTAVPAVPINFEQLSEDTILRNADRYYDDKTRRPENFSIVGGFSETDYPIADYPDMYVIRTNADLLNNVYFTDGVDAYKNGVLHPENFKQKSITDIMQNYPALQTWPPDQTDAANARFYELSVTLEELASALEPNYTANPLYMDEIEVEVPLAMTLNLYEQIKTTDTGTNTVIRGRTGVTNPEYTDRTDVPTLFTVPAPGELLQYGDISFTLGNDTSMDTAAKILQYMQGNGYNSVMASAKPEEEIAFTIGQLVLAKFQNPSGLSEAGTSIFTSTNNSGEPILVIPGIEGTGATQAGRLEMSNVDISKEFTDMITTQRGFQANSRIVTVSDEMLQELVNLKR